MNITTLNSITYWIFAGGSIVWCFGFSLFVAAILHEVVTNWGGK